MEIISLLSKPLLLNYFPFLGSSLFSGLNKEETWSFLNSSIELILTGVQSIFLDLSNLHSNLQQIAQLPFFLFYWPDYKYWSFLSIHAYCKVRHFLLLHKVPKKITNH